MTLNTLDFFILGVVVISGLFGTLRGFSSSILSLMTWAVALWLPFRFTNEFSTFLPASVESPTARLIVAGGCLFLGAFIALSLIGFLLRKLIGVTGLSLVDRLFGTVLGIVRGAVIVALLAMLATYSSSIPKERFWNESELMPSVLKLSDKIREQLPPGLSKLFVTKPF